MALFQSFKDADDWLYPSRDELGRVVRNAWVQWAKQQPDPKPHWLTPYDQLSEADKEADRQIGEAVKQFLNTNVYRVASNKEDC